ncbi:TransThyretin-Related family domain [Caenorhabditis elegans]|uniref:TransThyretin-Related family domain n=1 Tax=Caenorhabditis elegans TaxID=6239 RepID=D3NQ90_CAEEL|nr:TransThyretin-Related family domain [Caenorhabditis elegans]CCD68538.2 TransThyretin-Related family domain [Caenorhabditis elegans]|eukprot:NP_001255312.2 Uncharacterized protein CELE_F17E9.16 [Caenorhabditis elegans]
MVRIFSTSFCILFLILFPVANSVLTKFRFNGSFTCSHKVAPFVQKVQVFEHDYLTFSDKLGEFNVFRTVAPNCMKYQFNFEEDGDGKPDDGFYEIYMKIWNTCMIPTKFNSKKISSYWFKTKLPVIDGIIYATENVNLDKFSIN